jgi:ribonuclease Y
MNEVMARAREIEEEMLAEAKKKAQVVIDQAEVKAQKIEDQSIQKMEVIQNRLLAREEKMDEKLEKLEQEKLKLGDKQKDLENAIQDQVNKLAEIAKLTKDEAKQHLMDQIQVEYQADFVAYIEKLKNLKKEE